MATTQVTATSGGTTANGIALRVMVLTGVQPVASQTGATGAVNPGGGGTAVVDVTTTTVGSKVYGAAILPTVAALTAQSSTTGIDDVNSGSTPSYATFKGSSTTSSPGLTAFGYTALISGFSAGMAALEVLPNGTITELTGPALADTFTGTTVQTASFTVPGGGLLVALVAANLSSGVETMTVSDTLGLTWHEAVKFNTSADGYTGVWIANTPPWSILQSSTVGSGFGTAVITATYPNNVSAGTKLICYATSDSQGNAVSSVQDNNGNSFTQIVVELQGGSNGSTGIWVLDTPAGDVGTKPTITVTTSVSHPSCIIHEVSGLMAGNTSAILDSTAGVTNGSGGTTIGPPTYASTASNEFLVYLYGDDGPGSGTVTGPSGYTLDPNGNQGSGNSDTELAYKNSTGGTETGTWSITGGPAWALILVAFKLASGPPAAAAPTPPWTKAQFPPTYYVARHHPHKRRHWLPRIPPFIAAPVATNQQYTEILTAIIAASDINQTQINRNNITPVAVTGNTQNFISKTVTAVLAVLAVLPRMLSRTVTGNIAVSSALTASRVRYQVFTAVVAATASTQKLIGRILAGQAAVTGTLSRVTTRVLTAPTALTGTVTRKIARSQATGVAVIPAALKQTGKSFTTTVAVVPNTARRIGKILAAPVAVTATMTRSLGKLLSAPVAVSGGLVKRLGHANTTVIATAGTVTRAVSKSVSTVIAVSPTVSLTKVKQITLIAATAVQAALSKATSKNLQTALAMSPSLTRNISHMVSAVLAVPIVATASRGLQQVILNTAVAVSSVITRSTGKTLTTPIAALGTITNHLGHNVTAVIAAVPTVTRNISKTLIAPVAVLAAQAQTKVHLLVVNAATALTGGITRSTAKTVTAVTAFTGTVNNRITRTFTALVAVVPVTFRATLKNLTATVVVAVTQTQIKLRTVILSAPIAVTNTISRKLMPNLGASLIIGVGNIRTIARTIQGNLISAGQTVREIGRVFTAPVTIIPVSTQIRFKSVILAVSIAVTNTVQKKLFKVLPVQAAIIPRVTRGLFKTISSGLAVLAGLSSGTHQFFVTLTTSVAVTVRSGASQFAILAFKKGTAAFQWVLGSIRNQWRV